MTEVLVCERLEGGACGQGRRSAPHASWPSTPVTVRYSDGTGLPNIPDNDPARSGPRGMAIRFHFGEHEHTDIVAQPVIFGQRGVRRVKPACCRGCKSPTGKEVANPS